MADAPCEYLNMEILSNSEVSGLVNANIVSNFVPLAALGEVEKPVSLGLAYTMFSFKDLF